VAGVQAGAIVKVTVRLCDGRVVVGTVCVVEETVSGTKVRILSGACVLNVKAEQIIGVISSKAKPTKAQKKKLLLAFFAEFERVMREGR
jgi:hypothetical protein